MVLFYTAAPPLVKSGRRGFSLRLPGRGAGQREGDTGAGGRQRRGLEKELNIIRLLPFQVSHDLRHTVLRRDAYQYVYIVYGPGTLWLPYHHNKEYRPVYGSTSIKKQVK